MASRFRCRPTFAAQLALITGGALLFIFLFCTVIITWTRSTVVSESRAALKLQISRNAQALIDGAAAVVEEQMQIGASSLILPTVHALRDADGHAAVHRGWPFAYGPLSSYMDHPGQLRAPLTDHDTRPADDPATEAIGVRRFGELPISKSASSVYFVDQYEGQLPAHGFAAAQSWHTLHAGLRNRTSFMDLYAKPMWELNPEWIDIYVGAKGRDSERDAIMFRRYPGVVAAPAFCGTTQAKAVAELRRLVDVLDHFREGDGGELKMKSSFYLGDAQLNGKTITHVCGQRVTSVADVEQLVQAILPGNLPCEVRFDSYDPTARTWYIGAVSRASSTGERDLTLDLRGSLHFSHPYKSASRGEWMVTVSRAVRWQENCLGGLPECGAWAATPSAGGELLGVVSVDLYIPFMRRITGRIKTRQTGEAHLIYLSDDSRNGLVIASPQWHARYDDTKKNLKEVVVQKDFFDSATLDRVRREAAGTATFTEEAGDSQVTHRHLLEGHFAVVIETPLKEILDPIDDQLDAIDAETRNSFVLAAVFSVCAMLALGLAAALLSRQVSPSLRLSANEARLVASNIGSSNLFDGIEEQEDARGLAEVQVLRNNYRRMIYQLMERRARIPVHPPNPFYGMDLRALCMDPSSGEAFGGVEPGLEQLPCVTFASAAAGATAYPDVREKRTAVVSDTPWHSRLIFRSLILVALPFMVALTFVAVIIGMHIHGASENWLSPVRNALIDEDVATLPVRLEAKAEQLDMMFRRHTNSLVLWKSLIEKAYNSFHGLDSDPLTFVGDPPIYPNFLGLQHSSPNNWKVISDPSKATNVSHDTWLPGGRHSSTRIPGIYYNYWVSGYWGNLRRWDEAGGFKSPLSDSGSWTSFKDENRLMSSLDTFARSIYFSNRLTNIMVGFEGTENYRSFPFMDKTSLKSWTGDCVRGKSPPNFEMSPRRVSYTPLCRPWYELARLNGGDVTFNAIDLSASTGFLFLALSVALKDAGGNLFGVAGVEADIGDLQQAMSERLSDNGYFYLADSAGRLIVHPRLGAKEKVRIMDKEFTTDACEDYDEADQEAEMQWMERELPGILSAKSGSRRHNKCGKETSLIWQRVVGTDYVLFITVPTSDTTKMADAVQGSITTSIGVVVALSIGIGLPVGIALILVAACATSSAVRSLTTVVHRMTDGDLGVDVPQPNILHSRELALMLTHMQQFLTALRFGNHEYDKGNPEAEKDASLKALDLVISTQNVRGIGVVKNNLGLCLSVLEQQKNAVMSDQHDAVQLLQESVANGEELRVGGIIGADVVGQRLLGLSIALRARGQREQAFDAAARSIEVFCKEGCWDKLARVAVELCVDGESDGHLAKRAIAAAVEVLRKQGKAAGATGSGGAAAVASLTPREESPFLLLAIGHAKMYKNAAWLAPALVAVPRVQTSILMEAAVWAKLLMPASSDNVDSIMKVYCENRQEPLKWAAGPFNTHRGAMQEMMFGRPSSIQVCFVMDCTGSMSPSIHAAKAKCVDMARKICSATSSEVSMGFICYRDYDCEPNENIVPFRAASSKAPGFTAHIEELQTFIGGLTANGGGDTPEDMAGGLAAAAALPWSSTAAKFVVLVTDAPCHGSRFHNHVDSYPTGGKNGMPDRHLGFFRQENIQLIIVVAGGADLNKMISVFKKLYDTKARQLVNIALDSKDADVFAVAVTEAVVHSLGDLREKL